MKNLVSLAAAALLTGTPALSAPLEDGAQYTTRWSKSHAQTLANDASGMIRTRGYRCDTISSISIWFSGKGYTVKCNGYRYHYEIEDKGGRWTVSLK